MDMTIRGYIVLGPNGMDVHVGWARANDSSTEIYSQIGDLVGSRYENDGQWAICSLTQAVNSLGQIIVLHSFPSRLCC